MYPMDSKCNHTVVLNETLIISKVIRMHPLEAMTVIQIIVQICSVAVNMFH